MTIKTSNRRIIVTPIVAFFYLYLSLSLTFPLNVWEDENGGDVGQRLDWLERLLGDAVAKSKVASNYRCFGDKTFQKQDFGFPLATENRFLYLKIFTLTHKCINK